MSEQPEPTLRVPVMKEQIMDFLLGPAKDLIDEELAPLKLRIAELERQVAELSSGKANEDEIAW